MISFVKFIASILLMFASNAYRGLVLSFLWNWFAPLALDVHPLNVAGAIGVSLVGHIFTGSTKSSSDDKDKEKSVFAHVIQGTIYSFTYCTVVWLFGYIVHLFLV